MGHGNQQYPGNSQRDQWPPQPQQPWPPRQPDPRDGGQQQPLRRIVQPPPDPRGPGVYWQQQQYPPPQAAPPARPPVQARKGRPLAGCLTLVIIALAIGIGISVAVSGGSGPSPYKAVVSDTAVINPADLAVTVHVTNTGKTAGTPTCTVTASDPSGAYSGVDVGTLTSPVQPGQTVTYVDNVTITHQGAGYVTSATVTC